MPGLRARPEQVAASARPVGAGPPPARAVGALPRRSGARGAWQFLCHQTQCAHGPWHFLPATLEFVLCVFGLAFIVGIPVGILAGARATQPFDRLTGAAAVLGAAAPVFALALLAQQLFFN